MADASQNCRDEELLAAVVADLIGDVRHVAVGNTSPIPTTAALLARARGKGQPYVSLLGSRKHTFFTDGGRELFDCAGQGRIDVFFLSGGEIDGEGNVNLVSVGEHDQFNYQTGCNFRSRHPGGAHFLYADGHVEFLNEDISDKLFANLGDRNGGRVGEFYEGTGTR